MLGTVLLDLDGVLYVGETPIAGAVDAVARLRASGLALRFVTNTTTHPRAAIAAKLRRLGIVLDDAELITPAALAVRHCLEQGHRRVALVMHEEVKVDFAALEEADDDAAAVIVGDLGEQFGFAPLNRAFRLIMGGAELVALQKNRYWMTPDGLSLDAGAFVAALEFASGHEALVVGKPAPLFFRSALATAGATPAQAAMVGDDVESDVGGAQRAGLRGILVRTGKYREDRLRASGVVPDAIIGSIADLPELLAGALEA
jgi:HAD superfamily hydrolase (TIGR01458 family)